VREYIRAQSRVIDALAEETTKAGRETWGRAYLASRISGCALEKLVTDFATLIADCGAFAITRQHIAPMKAMPGRDRWIVGSYFMEPIGLRQGFLSGGPPFTEQAVLLRTCQGEFRPKRASLGIGTGCVVLTQHLLERVYERTEVDHSAFRGLVHGEIQDLLTGLALSEAAGLWLQHDGGEASHRLTAVPFSNGLVVMNTRILFANPSEGQLGFRVELPSGKKNVPYINRRHLLDVEEFLPTPNVQPILITCGVTYFHATTLDSDELDYYYGFQALKEEIGDEFLCRMAFLEYAPRLPHEREYQACLSGSAATRVERLGKLLKLGWLKSPTAPSPICFLQPSPI
jgi:hypothetical protein